MQDNLKPLPISELLDKQFFIPHYQRGYRWINLQVEQLLDDIDSFSKEKNGKANENTFYCLQPIVVKVLDEETKNMNQLQGEWYEVIDGQQRLTTIYILLQYINQKWLGEDKIPQFEIIYETREGCADFLLKLKVEPDNTVDIDKSNIDYYHFSQALQTIRKWQLGYHSKKGMPLNTAKFQSTFFEFSKIIWYQVAPHEKSQALFERLNIGKIPLTNAELTKALFLSSGSFKDFPDEERRIKQFEIARLWDEIEQKLNHTDVNFWSFITNRKRAAYDTRIELLLDLISGKNESEKDPLYTFLKFSEKLKEGSLSRIWEEIEQCYHTLTEWYTDRNYYHKIGYLVAARQFGSYRDVHLGQLVKDSMVKTKKEFNRKVDALIREAVKVELSELRYERHYNQIFNSLLLFNVETYRESNSISEFYPFKQHKDNQWSLEHIHARKSESFDKTKKDPWLRWLDLHLPLLREFSEHSQSKEIYSAIEEVVKYNNEQLTWERFSTLFSKVNEIFTTDTESMDRDSEGIANLALLSQPDNAALNNSVFEIKRREIIRLDKEGSFIPVCTRRVFVKYYNEDGVATQHYYWSEADREKYVSAIKEKLAAYLPENHIQEDADENE